MRFVVLDTETTGFSPHSDRIVEIAAAEFEPRSGILGRDLYYRLNPGRGIPARVTKIHGIDDEAVKDKPTFANIADELVGFLEDATLVIHNSDFDTRMLDAELSRAGKPSLQQIRTSIVDTLAVSQNLYPLLSRHNLDELCNHLKLSLEDREFHGAAVDIRLLSTALAKMAVDYDEWIASSEGPCAAELDDLANALSLFVDQLLNSISHSTPEAIDRSLSLVSTALRSLERQRQVFLELYAKKAGDENWSCKHLSARWEAIERVSWKQAYDSLIPSVDLDRYRSDTLSQTVTPNKAPEVDMALTAMLKPIVSRSDRLSLNCVVRALWLLANAERSLASERQSLRTELLAAAQLGYSPSNCAIRPTPRQVDYESACRENAPDADFDLFLSRSTNLKIDARVADSCHALWQEL